MRARPRKLLSTLLTLALGVAVFAIAMPATAEAATSGSEDVRVDPYLVTAKYHGIAVDFGILNEAVTDVTSVRVTVKRTNGSDVVKTSKETGSVASSLNEGRTVTVPIVIRSGSYDEAGSSSWNMPAGIWTAETIPTEIVIEILNDDGVALTKTFAAPTEHRGITLADVLPAVPSLSDNPRATFHNAADYKGIVIDFSTVGFTDAESLSIRVDREKGDPVIKTAKPALLNLVNNGATLKLTSPIIIQSGTYNEAGSGSWNKPSQTWTSETIPTQVTITITRTYGPDVTVTIPTIKGDIADIMPAPVVTPPPVVPTTPPAAPSTPTVVAAPPTQPSEPTGPAAPVRVAVPTDLPAGSTFEVVIPESQVGGEIALGTLSNGSVSVPVQVNVSSPLGVEVTFPANTQMTATGEGAENWDGVIQLPKLVENVSVPATSSGQSATVALAIEVGSESFRITFDTPVKLVLAGQAGMSAGFAQGGVFTAIDMECTSSSPTDLAGGECWLNEGNDLVIWTSHFTTFIAYELDEAAPVANPETPGAAAEDPATSLFGRPAIWFGFIGLLLLIAVGVAIAARVRMKN